MWTDGELLWRVNLSLSRFVISRFFFVFSPKKKHVHRLLELEVTEQFKVKSRTTSTSLKNRLFPRSDNRCLYSSRSAERSQFIISSRAKRARLLASCKLAALIFTCIYAMVSAITSYSSWRHGAFLFLGNIRLKVISNSHQLPKHSTLSVNATILVTNRWNRSHLSWIFSKFLTFTPDIFVLT